MIWPMQSASFSGVQERMSIPAFFAMFVPAVRSIVVTGIAGAGSLILQSAVFLLQREAALSERKFRPDVSKSGIDFGIVACGIAF